MRYMILLGALLFSSLSAAQVDTLRNAQVSLQYAQSAMGKQWAYPGGQDKSDARSYGLRYGTSQYGLIYSDKALDGHAGEDKIQLLSTRSRLYDNPVALSVGYLRWSGDNGYQIGLSTEKSYFRNKITAYSEANYLDPSGRAWGLGGVLGASWHINPMFSLYGELDYLYREIKTAGPNPYADRVHLMIGVLVRL